MKKKVYDDYEALCSAITDEILEQIKRKPKSHITIAGGDTPRGVYTKLASELKKGEIDYSEMTFVSLDEWVGLGVDDFGSCKNMIFNLFLKELNFKENQVVFFDGLTSDLSSECKMMTNYLESVGGIDLMILGVGLNGHLGFNEPNIETKDCEIVELDDTTKKVMSKYFNEEKHLEHGITLGYNQIFGAKEVIVMANGKHKKDIVAQAMHSEPKLDLPISMLKKHKNSYIYIDVEANTEEE